MAMQELSEEIVPDPLTSWRDGASMSTGALPVVGYPWLPTTRLTVIPATRAASYRAERRAANGPWCCRPLATSSWTTPTSRPPSAHCPTCWPCIWSVPYPPKTSPLDSPFERRSARSDDRLPSPRKTPMRVATYTRISTDVGTTSRTRSKPKAERLGQLRGQPGRGGSSSGHF